MHSGATAIEAPYLSPPSRLSPSAARTARRSGPPKLRCQGALLRRTGSRAAIAQSAERGSTAACGTSDARQPTLALGERCRPERIGTAPVPARCDRLGQKRHARLAPPAAFERHGNRVVDVDTVPTPPTLQSIEGVWSAIIDLKYQWWLLLFMLKHRVWVVLGVTSMPESDVVMSYEPRQPALGALCLWPERPRSFSSGSALRLRRGPRTPRGTWLMGLTVYLGVNRM